MKRVFITGAAGFIGSTLADRLLEMQLTVVGYDNFSTGQAQFLERARPNVLFTVIEGDICDERTLSKAMAGCDTVLSRTAFLR